MNPKNYTTLETSKRLKELGVLQNADMCHQQFFYGSAEQGFSLINMIYGINNERYAAFNASELGAMLPTHFFTVKCEEKHELERGLFKCVSNRAGSPFVRYANTEVEAKVKTLIDYIAVVDVSEVNNRYKQYLEI